MYGCLDTVGRMKTTIELPDALAAEARDFARERHTTLRDLVVEGLRAELTRRRAPGPRVDFIFPTVRGKGLQAGVEPDHLTELAYDLS